jgi:hypothetical protein
VISVFCNEQSRHGGAGLSRRDDDEGRMSSNRLSAWIAGLEPFCSVSAFVRPIAPSLTRLPSRAPARDTVDHKPASSASRRGIICPRVRSVSLGTRLQTPPQLNRPVPSALARPSAPLRSPARLYGSSTPLRPRRSPVHQPFDRPVCFGTGHSRICLCSDASLSPSFPSLPR